MKVPASPLSGFLVSCLCGLFAVAALESAGAQLIVNTAADEEDLPAGPDISPQEAMRDSVLDGTVTFAPSMDGQVIDATAADTTVTNNPGGTQGVTVLMNPASVAPWRFARLLLSETP